MPQLIDIVDNEDLRCAVLPGDHLYNEIEAETANVRQMTLKEVVPDKGSEVFRAMHRMVYRIKPIIYTGHELHVHNLSTIPHKIHLFYYAGDNFHLP